MNTNYTSLNEAALDIASKASSTASELYAKTAEILARETPILCEEYVRWVFWSSAIEIVVLIALVAIPMCATKYAIHKIEDTEVRGGVTAVGCIVSAICFGIALYNGAESAKNMVKAHVAPRVVLVEFVAKQVNP